MRFKVATALSVTATIYGYMIPHR